MRMVGRGAGLAVVPLAAIERASPQNIKSVPLNEPWARRTLMLCAKDFAHLPSYAKALLHALTLP
jgi:DNA-binding transcriptional LysR family regulator